MKTAYKIIYFIIGVSIILSVIYLFGAGESPEEYKERILRERKKTEEFMQESDESPFRGTGAPEFKGLNFFPVDQSYTVAAYLSVFPLQETITIPATAGGQLKYKRYGTASFELQGKQVELLVLEPVDNPGTLFIGFRDETSGEETYGGGRYLDLPMPAGRTLLIDFNMAYNPYCTYVADFVCPIPPAENTISLAIRAGEMNYD